MAERARYEPGTFCWVGLATSDLAGARRFYASLFSWEGEDQPTSETSSYTLLRRDGKDVAILYRQMPAARAAGAPPHWTSFISVEDAEATAARAGELGGAAVFGKPFDVPGEGRVAAIRDPTGAIVSLWQPCSPTGAALVDEVGALCWNELTTSDVERAMSFYGELLGWEYETDASGYTTITYAGRPNGGIRRQSGHDRAAEPSWLPYFTVASADDAARQAERAGGRTVYPTTDIALGRCTVLADPQGATFTVLESVTDSSQDDG